MRRWVLFFLLIVTGFPVFGKVGVEQLRCEYAFEPLGVEAAEPRFSWEIVSSERGVAQRACQILVASRRADLDKKGALLWDSGWIRSSESQQIAYQGAALKPGARYYYKVRIETNRGEISPWSPVASFSMGLFTPESWGGACWIGLEEILPSQRIVPGIHGAGPANLDKGLNKLPLLRKSFRPAKKVARATAYVSGLGQFEFYLNGKKAGNHFLDPAWTQYDSVAQYVTFDITPMIQQGENVAGVMLGNGFFHIPRERYRKCVQTYGYPKMICALVLEFADGSVQRVVSDTSWRAVAGPVQFSSVYGGEDWDARLAPEGWNAPGFDDTSWHPALQVSPMASLRSQTTTPMQVMDRFRPVSITRISDTVWVYDLGQNASAIPFIRLRGKRGETVRIIPGELIDDQGRVTQKASGGPCYFSYTLSGGGVEEWQPRFSYYGFRYLQVEGAIEGSKAEDAPQSPMVLAIEGLHVRNSARTVGGFSCSNPLFNRIFSLIDWAVRSNMSSVYTDCPHREKLGWLEVPHLMGSATRYNYDIARFYTKIIEDIKQAQLPNGMIPDIAPEYPVFEGGFRDSPEWGSAGVILPWYLYQWYGDTRILRTSYTMMSRYADYLGSRTSDNILMHGLGDWYDLGPAFPGESQLTPRGLTPTAIYYYDLTILAQTAALLGLEEDAQSWSQKAAGVKSAFNEKFFDKEARQYGTGSQTANAMALYMDLVPAACRADVVANLKAGFAANNNSLTAGDIGFRYLLRVLEQENGSDLIYTMNNRDDVPGYGFQLAKGATSLTESWAALRDVSNNHCMLGHLMEWFYSGAAGIRQVPGYTAFKQIEINPQATAQLTGASAWHQSPYGKILSSWHWENKHFILEVEIPANTRANLHIPLPSGQLLYENGKPVTQHPDITILSSTNGKIQLEIGSGHYRFKTM